MTIYNYTLFAFTVIVCYLIIADKNMAAYIELQSLNIVVQIKRLVWMIRFHPRNPIANWMWNRRMDKMIRKMQEEYSDDSLRQDD